ncbi:MAG: hypothetical protein GQ570_06215 [Helicobacteraceae bacterium]|nr:hypothetical protein [Helicobacteraceae bacterium]
MQMIDDYINFFQEEVYHKENISLPDDVAFFTCLQHIFGIKDDKINASILYGSEIIRFIISQNVEVNISVEENKNNLFIIFRQVPMEKFLELLQHVEDHKKGFYITYKYDGCYCGISISKISSEVESDHISMFQNCSSESKIASITTASKKKEVKEKIEVVKSQEEPKRLKIDPSHTSAQQFTARINYANVEEFSEILDSLINDLSSAEDESVEELSETMESVHDDLFKLQNTLRKFRHFNDLATTLNELNDALSSKSMTDFSDEIQRNNLVKALNTLFEEIETWVATIFYDKKTPNINYADESLTTQCNSIKALCS